MSEMKSDQKVWPTGLTARPGTRSVAAAPLRWRASNALDNRCPAYLTTRTVRRKLQQGAPTRCLNHRARVYLRISRSLKEGPCQK